MSEIGSFDAKNKLSALLAEAERGEETRHHAPRPAGGEACAAHVRT